ncbi:hypothetical protein WJX79_004205 [Trebouxia sp. C0005]
MEQHAPDSEVDHCNCVLAVFVGPRQSVRGVLTTGQQSLFLTPALPQAFSTGRRIMFLGVCQPEVNSQNRNNGSVVTSCSSWVPQVVILTGGTDDFHTGPHLLLMSAF